MAVILLCLRELEWNWCGSLALSFETNSFLCWKAVLHGYGSLAYSAVAGLVSISLIYEKGIAKASLYGRINLPSTIRLFFLKELVFHFLST